MNKKKRNRFVKSIVIVVLIAVVLSILAQGLYLLWLL